MNSLDNEALDALAIALAPRLLREVRALIAGEAEEPDEGGLALLKEMGYELGPAPPGVMSIFRFDEEPEAKAGKKRKPKRKRRPAKR